MYHPLSFCSSVSVRVPVYLNDHASMVVAKKEKIQAMGTGLAANMCWWKVRKT